jgi:hypothetical protein
MSRALTPADILAVEDYVKVRLDKRRALIELKRRRQLHVGPHVTVTFECWDSMWYQVQEMLYIEKGGDAQLEDELLAYGPMVPNGDELVATLMFEIEDAGRRARVLAGLGGVENCISLSVGPHRIMAVSEEDVERSTADGKTSAVHFLHFPFDAAQKAAFKAPGAQVLFAIGHANYQHMAMLPEAVRQELAGDLD